MNRIDFHSSWLLSVVLLLALSSVGFCALQIVEPAAGAVVYGHENVRFLARWVDETRPPGAAELRYLWSSDVDGPLAEGMRTSVTGLSYRAHKLTLEAVVGDSVLGSVETAVTVIKPPEQFTLSERNDWESEFSPSGTQVAYTSFRSGDPEIWVASVASRAANRITYKGGLTPTWSPDEQRLAFWSDRAGGRDLWIVDLTEEQKTAVQLTFESGSEWMPAFSPVDGRLIYASKNGRRLNLKIIDTNDPDAAPVEILGPGEQPVFPRWFPDGKELLFTSYSDTLPAVCRLSLESGAVARIGSPGAEDADISPDGRLIVMVRHGELWLHRLQDGYERPLTRDHAGALSPRFSPDGSQVIYASTRSGNYDLWLLDLPLGE